MTTPTTTALLVAAITLGLSATGCGDDDPEPLTKAEFVAEANAICAGTNEQLDAVFESVWTDVEELDTSTPEGQTSVFVRFDAAVDEAMPHVRRQLADLRELTPPRDDAEEIARLLDDTEAAFDEFARLMNDAAAGDQAAMAALEDDDPLVDVDRRAREYGLVVCGER